MNFTRSAGRPARSGQTCPPSHRRSVQLNRRCIGPAGLLLIALALTACSGESDGSSSRTATTSPERAATSVGDAATSLAKTSTSVAEVECDLEGVQLSVAAPTCYAVTVPQDWSNPSPGDSVVLQAAVFHATNPAEAAKDPVIYLQGGPGVGSLGDLKELEPSVVTPFVATRDVIVFDQRGTGQSMPSLECDSEDEGIEISIPASSEVSAPIDTVVPNATEATEVVEVTDGSGAFSDTGDGSELEIDWEAEMLKQTAECHRQLTANGVKLTAYNSIASAQDIDAIRAGLGYDKLDVVGISYGTRLAQTYMRMFPTSIRSVVIDSVLPVAQTMFESAPLALQQALQNLFDRCRADAECNDAYPNFENDFWALVDQLNAQPVELDQTLADGTTWTIPTDGSWVIGVALSSLYTRATFERFPEMVSQATTGNYELLVELDSASTASEAPNSSNMYNSVECNERVPFESATQLESSIPTEGEFSRLANYFHRYSSMFETCEVWPSGTAPAVENEPVVSEIPTLLLTGSFDPVTPPSFARSVAEHLANSTVVEFPSEGHWVLRTECAQDLARTFIDDPSQAPDTSCVEAVPPPQWVAN